MKRHRVEIPARFRGPPDSANGGYACGSFAELAGEPRRATVTLRRPPALDRPFFARGDGEATRVEDEAGNLVAEVERGGPGELEPPQVPDLARAREASARSPFRTSEHPYATCFVCGPRADDGLHIHPGALDSEGLTAAAPALVPPDLLDADGAVPARIVWAMLDCPTLVPAYWGEQSMLGRLAGEVLRPVDGSAPLVAVGWGLGREGRKLRSAAAVLSSEGELLARSEALWIRLRTEG